MTTARSDPPNIAPERVMLDAWLDYQRATLETKCDGLSHDQLRMRSVEPSSLSLIGLVRHMAEVERNWFRRCIDGEDIAPMYYSETDPDGDFDNVDTADIEADVAAWRAECDRARAIAAAAESLDVTGVRRGEMVSLRWVMVHMIEEYARHNGHADFLRERIDGATGD